MTKPADDLEAVRIIADALKDFEDKDKNRIIRWAKERLNLPSEGTSPQIIPVTPSLPAQSVPGPATVSDIKAFVNYKNPRSDVQFATTVAYYYQFEAPEGQRKNAVGSADLQEAARLASKPRFKDPGTALRNAHMMGLLDKGSERGTYSINSIGENLVAMTLPSSGSPASPKVGVKKSKNKKKAKKKGYARKV